MNYIKPEDIKEYVSKNPEGIAGMSEELAVMVNHFAELIIRECADLIDNKEMITALQTYDEIFVAVYDTNFANSKRIREHFGVEE